MLIVNNFILKNSVGFILNNNFTQRETLIFYKEALMKELLKTKGIKQKWLAQKLGVSEVTVSNWVQEKSVPSKKNMEKLSEILDVSLKDLMY